jgi:hypothetical protein
MLGIVDTSICGDRASTHPTLLVRAYPSTSYIISYLGRDLTLIVTMAALLAPALFTAL